MAKAKEVTRRGHKGPSTEDTGFKYSIHREQMYSKAVDSEIIDLSSERCHSSRVTERRNWLSTMSRSSRSGSSSPSSTVLVTPNE